MSRFKLKNKVICGISTLLLCQAYQSAAADALASTQVGQIIRSTAEAGRLNQSLTNTTTAPPPSKLAAPSQEESVSRLSPTMAKVSFMLARINVQDADVFTQQELVKPYQNFIGKVVTLGDIETITQELTTRYQKAGYVLTRVIIPPQHIKSGIITLRVIEGYVDQVTVQGNVRPRVAALLKAYGEKIKATRPLQVKVLERYALLANDLPGIAARVVLAPSQAKLGTADLTIVAEQETASAYVAADNRGTKFLGPQQFTFGAQANSVLRAGDSTGVQYLTTGNNQLSFLQLTHSEFIGLSGLKLDLSAGYTRAMPGSSLTDLEIVGKSSTANAQLTYPLIRSRSLNLSLHSGIGMLDSHTTVLSTDLYNDHIRFATAGVDYSQADHWLGVNSISAELTQGLSIIGASQDENISRPDAGPRFTKYTVNLSRLQALPAQFSLLLAGQGQYTRDSLYAAEQYGFGGANFGRGYDASEITGDRGAAGKIELRYDLGQQQFYTFYDIGTVWNLVTQAQPAKASAASTGIGARLRLTNWLGGNIEVDKPLTKVVGSEGNRDIRVYVGITLADSLKYHATKAGDSTDNPLPDFNPIPISAKSGKATTG